MKQVYLVHKSGGRLGPFRWDSHNHTNFVSSCGEWRLSDHLVYSLGFTIEDALPDKITVTKEKFETFMRALGGPWHLRLDDEWRRLCEEAEKDL